MITLLATHCENSVIYRVTFEGPRAEDVALAYMSDRGWTHAFDVDDTAPVDPRHTRVVRKLMPESCPHGLSMWLCEGPSHYPPDPF